MSRLCKERNMLHMFGKGRIQKKNRMTKSVIMVSLLALVLSFGGCANHNNEGTAGKSQQEDEESSVDQKESQGSNVTSQDDKQGNIVTDQDDMKDGKEGEDFRSLENGEINARLLEYGQPVLELMQEKMKSDTYMKAMGYSSSIFDSEYLQKLREADYAEPQKVYKVTLKEEFINLIWAEATNYDTTLYDLSDELQKELRGRIKGSMINLMNQRWASVESVAISSMLSTGKSFVASGLAKEPVILVYVYENTYPLVVSVMENEEGILAVVSNILFIDDFKAETEDDLRSTLSEAFSGMAKFMAGTNIEIEQIQ